MFTRLGHRAVSSRNNQDRAVHLRSARDHVLHIVSVARAVNVSIVTVFRFVLNVRRVDRDAASAFFRRRVDLVVGLGFAAVLLGENRRDSSRERRLAVVDVTNRADVDVRLLALKMFLCHFWILKNE